MTTIAPFAAGSYLTARNAAQLTTLKNQLNDLSNQVSSGQVSQTYGGLGSGRSTALGAQATLSALGGYAAGITAGQTRTNLAVTSLTQVVTLGTSASQTLNNGLQSVATSSVAGRSTALGDLQTALDALNQSAAGNYLFGGGDASTQPVVDGDTLLNGTTGSQGQTIAGLSAVIAERVDAEVGPNQNGRLTQTPTPSSTNTGTSVTVTDEADSQTRGMFGFTLAAAPTVTGSALSATYTAAASPSPASFTLNLTAQPQPGDSATISLTLPDGTSKTLTLKAATTADATSTTSFAIGSSVSDTMNNLSATLNKALKGLAGGTLAVNATADAASSFFTGSAKGGPTGSGIMPQRIQYDASNNPIGYKPATAADTVLWYQGENTYTASNTPTSALDSQSIQVSTTSKIGTGARAIDPAVQNVLAGLATMAFALPTTNDDTTGTAYQSVINRAGALLASTDGSSGVQNTVTQLSLAAARLTNAGTTNAATQNTVQNTLDGIEQAPTEEVVAKLLDVQNRLQASYQITSTLSKLSLVNYIS